MAITIGSAPTGGPTAGGAYTNATLSKPKTVKNYYILGAPTTVFDSVTLAENWTFKGTMLGPNAGIFTASVADAAGWYITNVSEVYAANEPDMIECSGVKIPA